MFDSAPQHPIRTRTLADTIREQHPRAGSGHHGHAYCIGAAVLRYAHKLKGDMVYEGVFTFPGNVEIAQSLMMLNQRLCRSEALCYASRIIRANDNNFPDEAWSHVSAALSDQRVSNYTRAERSMSYMPSDLLYGKSFQSLLEDMPIVSPQFNWNKYSKGQWAAQYA